AQNADQISLRLATYNVHLGGARQATAQLLAEWQPDVLCLQEARDPARLPAAGGPRPTGIWQPVPGGAWGSGLLIPDAVAVPFPLPDDLAGWVVGAEIPAGARPGARPLRAFSVHAPPGPERSYVRMVGRILD